METKSYLKLSFKTLGGKTFSYNIHNLNESASTKAKDLMDTIISSASVVYNEELVTEKNSAYLYEITETPVAF